MSIFDLQLNEFAMWVPVLFFVIYFSLLWGAFHFGYHRAEKKYKFYIPFSGDLPLGAIYRVRKSLNQDGNHLLFLERKDGTKFGEGVIIVRPSKADAPLFASFSDGTLVRSGTGGLQALVD